jgi:chemotaxis protein CheD
MNPNEDDHPVIYLKAAELHFSDKPSSVMTVLGSCLSVTMFHRRARVGAICHGLLPKCRERAVCRRPCAEQAKYVECAILMMVKLFDENKLKRSEIEVKVFGGADMFSMRLGGKNSISVGRQNIEIAQQALEKAGMRVIALDVGGTAGRKLFFNTATGEVLMKRLQASIILADNRTDTK